MIIHIMAQDLISINDDELKNMIDTHQSYKKQTMYFVRDIDLISDTNKLDDRVAQIKQLSTQSKTKVLKFMSYLLKNQE